MRILGISCACGEADVVAVSPGHETPKILDLFYIEHPEAPRAWCSECWNKRFRATEKANG